MLSVCEQLVVLVHGCRGIGTPDSLARLRLMGVRLQTGFGPESRKTESESQELVTLVTAVLPDLITFLTCLTYIYICTCTLSASDCKKLLLSCLSLMAS